MRWYIKGQFLAALGLLVCTSLNAQSLVRKDSLKSSPRTTVVKVKPPRPISTELSVGLRLNTNGWSIFVDRGKVVSDDSKLSDRYYNIKLLQLEFSEHKHPKEIKSTNGRLSSATGDKAKPFIYGKINNFYALKFGYGKRRMIAGKMDPNNVSVHWVYLGGLSFGLQKPYYIDAYVSQDNPGSFVKKSIKYSEDKKADFLTSENIVGSSGWTKGIGETKIIPGLHAKTGLNFDFAASPRTKLALEVGVGAELYMQKIEIMAEQKGTPFLFNAYVGLQFGKRW